MILVYLGISLLMLSLASTAFSIADANPLNETNPGQQKSDHPMSYAWSLQPLIGICGTMLNSFVLYMGYCERQTFIRPVNAMIWYVPVMDSQIYMTYFSKLGQKPCTD